MTGLVARWWKRLRCPHDEADRENLHLGQWRCRACGKFWMVCGPR